MDDDNDSQAAEIVEITVGGPEDGDDGVSAENKLSDDEELTGSDELFGGEELAGGEELTEGNDIDGDVNCDLNDNEVDDANEADKVDVTNEEEVANKVDEINEDKDVNDVNAEDELDELDGQNELDVLNEVNGANGVNGVDDTKTNIAGMQNAVMSSIAIQRLGGLMPGDEPDASYTVFYYLEDTTDELSESKTIYGQTIGDTITETAILIEGYSVIGSGEESITLDEDSNEIVFYYEVAAIDDSSAPIKTSSAGMGLIEVRTAAELEAALAIAGIGDIVFIAGKGFDFSERTLNIGYGVTLIFGPESDKSIMDLNKTTINNEGSIILQGGINTSGNTVLNNNGYIWLEGGRVYGPFALNGYGVQPYDRLIQYNKNDGSNDIYGQSTPMDGSINYLEILDADVFSARQGYKFINWNTLADGSGNSWNPGQTYTFPSQERLFFLYAQWSPISYKVSFNANGGTGSMADQNFVYDVAQALSSNGFEKDGFSFDGWALTKDGAVAYSNEQVVKNLKSIDNDEIKLFAIWSVRADIEYTVHYYLEGTETSLLASKTVDEQIAGDTIVENAAVIDGYTADEQSKSLTLAASGNEIVFYYTANDDIEYIVHYYAAGTTTRLAQDKAVDGQTMASTVTEQAAAIDGYTVDEQSKSLTLAASGNEIVFYYTANDDIEYIVHYYEAGTTTKLAQDKAVDGQTMASTVTEQAAVIDGYTADEQSKSLTLAASGNEIVFYYTANTDISYDVHYFLEGTTDSLAQSKTVVNQTMASTVTEQAAAIDGYTADEQSKSLTLAASGNEIVFYYTANDDIEYIVHYYEAGTTTKLAQDKAVDGQ
ncbi:MAG: InlB B-repeat-containing protein, partial [Oscillospiraceae bacterium]|nr:InlB B-repeat-containing protein [Oscillospiraceae bacterium]